MRIIYGSIHLVMVMDNHNSLLCSFGISTKDEIRNIYVTNDDGYVLLVVFTIRSFPHSWPITEFATRVTRLLPIVEQERLALPEHLHSHPSPGFSGVPVTHSLVFCVVFLWVIVCLVVPFFLFVIVFLRVTASDYPFSIFKFFFWYSLPQINGAPVLF